MTGLIMKIGRGRLFIPAFVRTTLGAAILNCSLCSPALAVPGDFDGDTTSDISVGITYRDRSRNAGSSAWLTRPTNGSPALFWTWTVPADAYVSGRFYSGDQKYYPGVVWVRDSRKPLEWHLKNSANQSQMIPFGLPGDTIPNLADWDGDGVDDLLVVRAGSGGILFWYVRLSSTSQVALFVFGVKGDKVGAFDTDGDGLAEMIALRNGYQWFIRKPAELTFTQVLWGLNGDIPLLPRDLDGDHLTDYIISRRTGSGQLAYLRYGNGQTATVQLGSDTSIPQIGNFEAAPGFAWSQRDTGLVVIKNQDQTLTQFQFGIPANAIIRPDGTVVQPIEDGRFGSPAGGSPVIPPTTPLPPTGTTAGCVRTFSSGWLLKPESQDSGGSRQGKPLILFTRNFPSNSCLNVIAANGQIIGHYGRYARERFYSGWGCGEGFSAGTLAQRATAAAGSKTIMLQEPNTGSCYGPGLADARTDRR